MGYFHRTLSEEIIKWLDRREVLAIKGPRQSGKTTLLRIIMEHLINVKKIEKEDIVYITFEDRDVLDAFSRDPKSYVRSYITNKNKRFFFLIDEFHYLKEGGQRLKLLYDIYENIKFIITGSSSLELTGSIAKYLVGRVFSFHLFQFSLGEFLETKERNLFNAYKENAGILKEFIEEGRDIDIKEEIFEKDFIRYFEEYIRFGGYPEVIKTDNIEAKQIILRNIYDTYITRDIVELLRMGDTSAFRTMVALLANSLGDLLNYNNLTTDAGSYFRQVKHYLSVLEETYVIRLLRPYFSNMSTELKKNPKVYFVDTGLRNYIIKNFNEPGLRPDGGKLVENAALSELYQKGHFTIKYWRTAAKAEVDFILANKEEFIPIEVKYSRLRSPEVSRGFRNFIDKYKPSKAVILTKGYWGKTEINGTRVRFAPVWYI